MAGVFEMEYSLVIGFMSVAIAPAAAATRMSHAIMTFHLFRKDQRPTWYRNLAMSSSLG